MNAPGPGTRGGLQRWLLASPAAWSGVLLGVAVLLRLPVFLTPFSSGDEATYTALANALLDGGLLYVGAVDHKPPMLVLTYAAVYAGVGRFAIHVVHALSVMVVAATGLLLGRSGRLLGMRPTEARLAGLAWVTFSAIGPAGDALAANGELFMLLPSVAAVALAASSSARGVTNARDVVRWSAAGILAAVATLYKYQAAAILLPLVVLACLRVRPVTALVRFVWLSAGFGLPLAAFVGWYIRAGELDALRLWGWTYPLLYAGSLSAGEVVRNLAGGLAMWCGTCGALLLAVARRPRGAPPVPVPVLGAFWLAGAALGVAAGGRFTLHYFLQLLPPLCLLASPVLTIAVERAGWWRRVLVCATAIPLGGFFAHNALGQPARPVLRHHTAVYRDVGRYLDQHAAPADTLFVWGNSPEIYFFSRRSMGTRFPFCNYHSGKIWGTAADRDGAPVPPGQVFEPAWDLLLEDLRQRHPRWIVDAAAGGLDRWSGHDLTRYPRLANEMAGHYTRHATVAGVVIYRRTDDPRPEGQGDPGQPRRSEQVAPGYTVMLRPRGLVAFDAIDDRFDVDIVRASPVTAAGAYHVSLVIRAGTTTIASRTSVQRANPQGGASCRIAPVVPAWEVVRHGRRVGIVPAWRYGGFTLEVVVRENGADGPLVYHLLQDEVVLGISWAGFLDRLWLPALLAGIVLCLVNVLADTARAGGSRRRIAAFDLAAPALVALAAAAFSRWAILFLAPLAAVWLVVPRLKKQRVADAASQMCGVFADPGRRQVRSWSPMVMATVLTVWLLLWHHSLIAVHGFGANDFSAHLRGIAALYVAVALAFSLLLHAALWRRPAGPARTAIATAAFLFVALSGVARVLDWGTFYYSAGHVDEDFWTNLFYVQNLGFASKGATWWPVIGLWVFLAAFALLLKNALGFARLAEDASPATGAAPPRLSRLLGANALAAFVCLAGVHAAWTLSAPAPARDISDSVREAFAGIPEYKVLEPLVARAAARPPARPALDDAFVSKLARAGVRLNAIDPEYPLMKPSIYIDGGSRSPDAPRVAAGTNLIVILGESLSSALLDDRVHGVEGLTPNFADFARHAYAFRNLYSSDFPTIKGQFATLASFAFDHRGLATTSESGNPLKSRFLFLSEILRPRGYQAVHVQADFGSFASTKAIFARHGYDRIVSAEDRELLVRVDRRLTKTWGVHDEDLFAAINRMLDGGGLRPPFLLTVATTDLHFPYTVLARHPGAGGNDLLDAVHTEDGAFGVFWRRFKQSPRAADTIVLLTADHALVRQAVRRGGADPRVSEFDYVTGLLYVPGEGTWAGQGTDTVCTQLDLLPTILDVMGIDLPNPFLGLSIFSDRSRHPLALGRDVPLDRLTPADRRAADAIGWTPDDQARFMALLRYLAVADRVTK